MAVRNAIGTDGSADSCQGPRISTPSGRGRRSMSTARMLPIVATNIATAATSRCRQRRQITSTASVAHHRASIPSGAGFESTPAARAVEVSQGVRIPTNTLSTAWSATSTETATGRTLPTSTPATTTTPTSSSQRLPEVREPVDRGKRPPSWRIVGAATRQCPAPHRWL